MPPPPCIYIYICWPRVGANCHRIYKKTLSVYIIATESCISGYICWLRVGANCHRAAYLYIQYIYIYTYIYNAYTYIAYTYTCLPCPYGSNRAAFSLCLSTSGARIRGSHQVQAEWRQHASAHMYVFLRSKRKRERERERGTKAKSYRRTAVDRKVSRL
jgi:hypothetical protein